ncbi:MAG TPA: hypothetical protein VMW17_11200 [Candidatus Binatia bacterium]|nr:hypothetical protein [Candidatus Binatia bacterium]
MHWSEVLSSLYGLRWVSGNLDAATVVRTLLVINTCNAVMCRLFAHNNGYDKKWWTVLGFVFGIWAVAVLIVLPKRTQSG